MIFITKIDGGKTVNEGLCLKCAKELGIKPVDDMIERMGLSEDDLENLNGEMTEAMNGLEGLLGQNQSDDDEADENDSQTATFPFLNKLFGAAGQDNVRRCPGAGKDREPPARGGKAERLQKQKAQIPRYLLPEPHAEGARRQAGPYHRPRGGDSSASSRSSTAARRTTPASSASRASARRPSPRAWPRRSSAEDVPYKLQNKEVYLMDLTALVAGTQFRGQFESRMKGLIEEVKKLGNIILVIDEVHNLVGAGDAEGSMNAANILKPALSRGEIQVIGATTFNEYRKHIEKDAALERRFQPVTVAEPTIERGRRDHPRHRALL